jgi:glucose-6-phosphate isomerase
MTASVSASSCRRCMYGCLGGRYSMATRVGSIALAAIAVVAVA